MTKMRYSIRDSYILANESRQPRTKKKVFNNGDPIKPKSWWESICKNNHKILIQDRYQTHRECPICVSKQSKAA